MAGMVTILGLGAGDFEQLTMGVYRKLMQTEHVYLRTEEHPVVEELVKEGLRYTSFDSVYEKHESFEDVYEEIAGTLLQEAAERDVVYAVPGHPLVAERAVQLLLARGAAAGISVKIEGGQSFLDPMFASLGIDPIEGFQLVDATGFMRAELQLRHHLIFCQVYDAFIASEVKLTLMDMLPDEYEVYIVTAAGSEQERIRKVPLYALDHEAELNNLTSVYVPPVREGSLLYSDFAKLREIIAELRGPNGCPWDKEQTHESLKKYLIEEAYELLEAIDEEDDEHIVEELGDVLLQVLLHAQIGEDDGWFSIDDVIRTLAEKMVRRHPHVFGDAAAETADAVVANWDAIKKAERQEKPASLLAGIPGSMPQLMRAYELQKKAAKVGFDWDDVQPMLAKVSEEWREFQQELPQMDTERMLAEFGDLLFAFVNVARYYKLNPEEAIHMTNRKFQRRFAYIEGRAAEQGRELTEYTLEQLDAFWEEAKENGI